MRTSSRDRVRPPIYRFGFPSTSGRTGWLAWLIAVLLIALVAAPAANAATSKRAPSVAAKQRRAGVVEDTVAITILKTLGLGAVTKGGAESFGYVLQAFGLGEGMTAGKLDSIRSELTEIKD